MDRCMGPRAQGDAIADTIVKLVGRVTSKTALLNVYSISRGLKTNRIEALMVLLMVEEDPGLRQLLELCSVPLSKVCDFIGTLRMDCVLGYIVGDSLQSARYKSLLSRIVVKVATG